MAYLRFLYNGIRNDSIFTRLSRIYSSKNVIFAYGLHNYCYYKADKFNPQFFLSSRWFYGIFSCL